MVPLKKTVFACWPGLHTQQLSMTPGSRTNSVSARYGFLDFAYVESTHPTHPPYPSQSFVPDLENIINVN